jgi:hypothetical protein
MKKAFLISAILTATMLSIVTGQDSKISSNFPWSLSLSYSPKMGLNFSDSYPSAPWESYLFSIDLRAEHKFADRLSYSFGLNFNRNHESISQIIFDGPAEISESDSYLIEFPLQINYHFVNTPKRIDPYGKLALRNSYLNFNKVGTIGNEPLSYKKSDYFLFIDLGFGTNFKINEVFSIIFESTIGYGLVYDRQGFGYLEGLLGLRYTF